MTGQAESKPWLLQVPTERLAQRFDWVQKKDPQMRISITATIWLARVDEFRRLEEQYLVSGEYEDSLQNHRATVALLISEGEAVVALARQHGLSPFLSAKVEDLEATIESLVITYQGQHRNNLPPARKKMIADLLGA